MNLIKSYSLLAGASLSLLACSTNHNSTTIPEKSMSSSPLATPQINDKLDGSESGVVGGWAPVFFTEMNQTKLDDIVTGMRSGRIKRATISYPTKMQSLAIKIYNYLEASTEQKITMQAIELKNTDQVQYNLTQVIVTLYF
ncbi:MAG: hypothetical protein RLZZ293_1285 [Pseudomonadota bacterium]|jgi:hypothetical protein